MRVLRNVKATGQSPFCFSHEDFDLSALRPIAWAQGKYMGKRDVPVRKVPKRTVVMEGCLGTVGNRVAP